jgi:ferric-dicitrate binding protein FerR (iron transport regulator)
MSERSDLDEDLEDLGEWNDSEWPEEDWLELVDYLSNGTPPEARAATKRRLETDAHFARLAVPLLAAWPTSSLSSSGNQPDMSTFVDRNADITRLLERTLGASGKMPDPPSTDVPADTGRRSIWPAWVAAALVLGSIAVYAGLQLAERPSSSPTPTAQFQIVPPASRDLVLADGSRVTLAPGSALLTGDSAEGGARMVRLVGSGTFIVQANVQRPFVVENHGVLVVATVASTFRVAVQRSAVRNPTNGNHTPDDVANVHVSVTDGKVVVQRAAKNGRRESVATLGPGEEISVSR